jgi:hypothetical protein
VGESCLGDAEEDARLAGDAAQVFEQLVLDTLLGPGSNPVHRGDQEVDKLVDDLLLADTARRFASGVSPVCVQQQAGTRPSG